VEYEWPVHARGILLRGARISGQLDLESAALRCPLVLESCKLDSQPPNFNYATVLKLVLKDCDMAGFYGTMLTGKHIELNYSRFSGTIWLDGATIAGPVICSGVHIRVPMKSDGSAPAEKPRYSSLVAETIRIGTNLYLNEGFSADGAIALSRAEITGQMDCSGAKLLGTDIAGNALIADGMKVSDVTFTEGFEAAGGVRLYGADITGNLSFSGAKLKVTKPDPPSDNMNESEHSSVIAETLKVGGDAWLNQGFSAEGVLRLRGAEIMGQLDCSGAQLTGTDIAGNALIADGMKVRDVRFRRGFTAAGAVRLYRADITGELRCDGAQLTGTDKNGFALVASDMKVAGNVYLDGGFAAAGPILLQDADIAGGLAFGGVALDRHDPGTDARQGDNAPEGTTDRAQHGLGDRRFDDRAYQDRSSERRDRPDERKIVLEASGLRVGQTLLWSPPAPVTGLVNLERASVRRLDDDWSEARPDGHWPPEGELRLAGFTYDGFGGRQPASRSQRLEWIRRNHTTQTDGDYQSSAFAAQPYEQLARVYREAGEEADARWIAIQRHSDLRAYGRLNRWRWCGNWLMDKTIRHGYQPLRAVGWLALLYVVVLLMFWWAQHRDSVIVPTRDFGAHSAPTALKCRSDYPCFYPAGYAFDVVIPIIKVGQADNWRPDGQAPWGWAYLTGSWLATGLGWGLTTLAVAGYTGIIRKE
jgi:uncharacterized protein YjbI with pentapeptide repeats